MIIGVERCSCSIFIFIISGCSQYRTHYRGPCGLPAISCKPKSTLDQTSGTMDGCSVYRDQYTWKCGQYERVNKTQDYTPPDAKFEGCSRYRLDYRGCYGRPADSVKPKTTVDQSSGRMDGCSVYRHEFVPYCSAEYQYARAAGVKPMESDHMSCAPFEGCSTYRVSITNIRHYLIILNLLMLHFYEQLDFVPKCSEKTPSMKPLNRASFSTGVLANCTTYRNDFGPFYFGKCSPCCVPAGCCSF